MTRKRQQWHTTAPQTLNIYFKIYNSKHWKPNIYQRICQILTTFDNNNEHNYTSTYKIYIKHIITSTTINIKLHISIKLKPKKFQKFFKKNFSKKIEVDAPTNLHPPPTPPHPRMMRHHGGATRAGGKWEQTSTTMPPRILCRLNERLGEINSPNNTMQQYSIAPTFAQQIHLYIYIYYATRAQK